MLALAGISEEDVMEGVLTVAVAVVGNVAVGVSSEAADKSLEPTEEMQDIF